MDLDIYPQIHGKPTSPQLLKINHLETIPFSSLIFFCTNFESKYTVMGGTILLMLEGTLEISLCHVFLAHNETI